MKLLMLCLKLCHIGFKLRHIGLYPLTLFLQSHPVQAEHRISRSSADPDCVSIRLIAAVVLNIERSALFLLIRRANLRHDNLVSSYFQAHTAA